MNTVHSLFFRMEYPEEKCETYSQSALCTVCKGAAQKRRFSQRSDRGSLDAALLTEADGACTCWKKLAKAGFLQVISGMAKGIDGAERKEARATEGRRRMVYWDAASMF
ncbi:MAG: hypothetical protein ACLTLQ_02030 [[Clostridium] scindens]